MGQRRRMYEQYMGRQNFKSRNDAFLRSLTLGSKNPTGKGKRLIVLHIGSEDRYQTDSYVLSKKKTQMTTTTT